MRLITLGVGAADSPRYRPAGLLMARGGVRAMLDGGPVQQGPVDVHDQLDQPWLREPPRHHKLTRGSDPP